MPDQFIRAPVTVSEQDLYNLGVAKVQEQYPNWEPKGAIDLILRICASFAAVGAELADTVDMDIFRSFGTLANRPPISAAPATIMSTWTMQDDTGYDIPALTSVGLKTAGMPTLSGFQVPQTVTVPNGSITVDILLVAALPGSDGNHLDVIQRLDGLSFVTDVSITGESDGGVDEEETSDYLNRLSQLFELWTTTPIRGSSFAIAARQVAGVYRAAAKENYNPDDPGTPAEKYVTVCCLTEDGEGVSSLVKDQVQAYITALRETNFVCPVVDPSSTPIFVSYTAYVDPSMDASAIQGDIADAITSYLAKATWGMPTLFNQLVPIWVNQPYVRLNKIIQAIENVSGVVYAEPVTIGTAADALGTDDILMAGPFPLPDLQTITASVEAAPSY